MKLGPLVAGRICYDFFDETLQKKDVSMSVAILILFPHNFQYFKWPNITISVSDKSIEVIWSHLRSFGVI